MKTPFKTPAAPRPRPEGGEWQARTKMYDVLNRRRAHPYGTTGVLNLWVRDPQRGRDLVGGGSEGLDNAQQNARNRLCSVPHSSWVPQTH